MTVIDTNVFSELMKPKPDSSVLQWARREPENTLFTTAITMAEVLFGIQRLPLGRRRSDLEEAAAKTFDLEFADRILPFDEEAAETYATLVAKRQETGRPIDVLDAQIAAITVARRATLATRNTRDFEHCGAHVVNPWEA
jgi:toxin FitB